MIFSHSYALTVFPNSDPSRFFSKPSLRSRNTIFTLGTRGSVISPTELEAPILVPHTAQRGEQRVGGGTNFSLEGDAERGWESQTVPLPGPCESPETWEWPFPVSLVFCAVERVGTVDVRAHSGERRAEQSDMS